jgi:hypothetical protein
MANLATHAEQELHVHIGDNSGNPEKHAFLNGLSNERVHVHAHTTDLGVYGNLLFLIEQSTSPFVQLFGDDDWVHPDWYDNVHHFDETPDLMGISGGFLFYPPGNRATVLPEDRFMQTNGFERAKDYIFFMLGEQVCNTFCFSIFKREAFILFHSYLSKHPLKCQFHDQLLLQTALLLGPMKSVDNGLVAYNTKVDATSSGLISNQQKMLMDSGLPNWFAELGFYLMGTEYALMHQFKEIGYQYFTHRNETTDVIFLTFFESFHMSETLSATLEQHGLMPHIQKIKEVRTAEQGIVSMRHIIAALNPALGERYAHFVNEHTHFTI